MTDGKPVVRRRVAGAEARAAERGAHDGARLHEIVDVAATGELERDRLACGINRQRELAAADVGAFERAGRLDDGVVVAARAAGDDALLHAQAPALDLVEQAEVNLIAADAGRLDLDLVQDVLEVLVELGDRVAVRRVERQRDHGEDLGEVHVHAAVVVCHVSRGELLVFLAAPVSCEERMGVLVGGPNRGQTRGLGRHDVDAVAEIGRHRRDARAHELHHLVLHISLCEHLADDGERHVVRADARARGTFQIYCHNTGVRHVVGIAQQLLRQLAAAFADSHRSEGAVARMRVGAQDHLPTTGEVLAHERMDHRNMRGNEDAAVLLRGRKAEDVVVLVDGAAHGAQRVVAVGEHVGQGEFRHARCARGLDDADERDVVAGHRVEADLQRTRIARGVVRLQNRVCNRLPPRLVGRLRDAAHRRFRFGNDLGSFAQEHSAIVKLDHRNPSISPGPRGQPRDFQLVVYGCVLYYPTLRIRVCYGRATRAHFHVKRPATDSDELRLRALPVRNQLARGRCLKP